MHNIWEFLLQTASVTLVAALLFLVKRLFEDKLSPRWQYGIWSLLALRILLPVTPSRQILLPLPLALETVKALAEEHLASAYTEVYTPLAPGHILPIITKTPESMTDWLFVLYTAGVLLFLLRYLASYVRLRLLLKQGEPVSSAMQHRIDTLCGAYRLRSCHTITVEGLSSAFVCGVFRPVLALPADKEVDDKVLLHELLHLHYLDALQNIGWCFLRALHWCNPLLYPVFRRIENDMESLCDQRVLERLDGEERREYGQILLSMVNEAYAHAPGTTSISNGGKNISRRIAAIVRFKKYPKGMALVSLCILLLLGTPSIIGTAGTYDLLDYQPQTESELTLAMSMARIHRCGTIAGALDTYAKGLLLNNGIYLATASPLSAHAGLETAMRKNLANGASAWELSPKNDLGFPDINNGYQIYNLVKTDEKHYQALLVLPVFAKPAEVTDYYVTSDGTLVDENSYRYDTCYVMIPVTVHKEDAWVVEETGERIFSTKYFTDTSYDTRSSDIPWLKEATITGETGTLTMAAKLSYHIDNTINTSEYSFLYSSTFNQLPQPNAVFKEIRRITMAFYTCENNSIGCYPAKQLGLYMARLDSEDELAKHRFPTEDISMSGDVSGSSTAGFNWISQTMHSEMDYTVTEVSTDTIYGSDEFPPELPYGHLVQIFWDSNSVEKFTILWEDVE